ncbi:MAG: tetratricopeptide repeat protein [Crocosphaera sp.]
MNPLSLASITKNNEETYDSLLVSIEAGIGLLQIFIAVCDGDEQREGLIANYKRDLAPHIDTYRVYLDPQEPSLRLAVSQQVKMRENAVAMVTGTERLGLGKNEAALDKFFGYLQWTREGLRELKMPIILWIPKRIFVQLPKKAPDFYSWRNGIFQFKSESSLVPVEELVMQGEKFTHSDQSSSIFSVEELEDSLIKAIAEWGEDSSNLEPLYRQLGEVYADRVQSGKALDREQEFILAEDYLKKALALQTKFKQEESLASSLNNLAELYHFQGRYSDADPLYLKALELITILLGDNHPDVATSLNNLAGLYKSQGRYSDAKPLYLQALELRKKLLGDNHPDIATSLNNLAGLYYYQGRYSDAESLYLQTLELCKQVLGDNHPDVASSLNNLAELYRFQGRYSDAELLYLQALELCKQVLGDHHPHVATSLNNLALLYKSQGRYSDAEPLYLQAINILRERLGDNHPNTQAAIQNYKIMLS